MAKAKTHFEQIPVELVKALVEKPAPKQVTTTPKDKPAEPLPTTGTGECR